MQVTGYWYGGLDESNDRHVSKRRIFEKKLSSDTASRCEEACLLNPCNVVTQWSHHSLLQ